MREIAEKEVADQRRVRRVLPLHSRDGVPEQELDLGSAAVERKLPDGEVRLGEPLQFRSGDRSLIVRVNIEPFNPALTAIG